MATGTQIALDKSHQREERPSDQIERSMDRSTAAGSLDPITRAAGNRDLENPEKEKVAQLAYSYWVQGGRRDGTAEQDWFRAEAELQRVANEAAV